MPHDFPMSLENTTLTPVRPAVTQWLPFAAGDADAELVRPFIPSVAWETATADPSAVMKEPPLPDAVGSAEVSMPWEEEPAAPPGGLSEGSWEEPVDTDVEAWTAAALAEDSGRAAPPWVDEPAEPGPEPDQPFPLDAFLIPENTTRLPAGLEEDRDLQDRIASEVADALSDMVAKLRSSGLQALLETTSPREPIDVVLAAVLSGYLSRRGH